MNAISPTLPVLDKVKLLLDLYETGKIKRLAQHEVNPGLDKGSRENYLYFTLPVCINFQRSSPAMWKAALETYNDPQTNYVFYPEELVKRSPEEIQHDLVKHKLALQKNKHPHIWTLISSTLHTHFNNDPREIMKLAQHDAVKLLHILQVSHKKHFPYLSGPKLSNYWPYILSHYTDLNLSNAHEISIIPDTHIIKSSIKLGLATPEHTSVEIAAIWKDLLKDSGIQPTQIHAVLWNWSRDNFHPDV